MNAVETSVLADRLNRLVKVALDTGEAASIEDAEKLFSNLRQGSESGHIPVDKNLPPAGS